MEFILTVGLLLLATACSSTRDRTTKISLEGGNVPAFVLSGSGLLGDFVVYGKKQRNTGSDRDYATWEIEPISGYLAGKPLDELKSINYGVLPQGYKQVYPENNASPPPLEK